MGFLEKWSDAQGGCSQLDQDSGRGEEVVERKSRAADSSRVAASADATAAARVQIRRDDCPRLFENTAD